VQIEAADIMIIPHDTDINDRQIQLLLLFVAGEHDRQDQRRWWKRGELRILLLRSQIDSHGYRPTLAACLSGKEEL